MIEEKDGVYYRIVCVGTNMADAMAAQARFRDGLQYDGVFLETYLATPGRPLAGVTFDRVVYGPKAARFLDWFSESVAPRLKETP